MADRNGYIGRAPGDSSVIVARKVYEPTGVQTDFTFNSGYTPGYCDVYLNGVRLIDEKDFTASNGSTVGLTSAAQSGDVVELVVYKAYNLGVPLADVTGNLDVTGNISASSSITADGAFYGDGSNLSNIAGVAITQYIAANSLTVLGSPGVSTITRLGATDLNVTGIITANGLSGNVTGAALTITGNATFNSNVTIGGTLTYEDVTNVDALGIVTARAGVNVSGGELKVGSAVTFSGVGVATFIGAAGVAVTITPSTGKVQATTFEGPLTGNVTGDITGDITGAVTGTTGSFSSNLTVGSGITFGSAGVATFSGTSDVHLLDSVRLNVGDGSDLAIYHDANNSYIQDSGTGVLRIASNQIQVTNAAASEVQANFIEDGAVELYFNNSKKLETTNNGSYTTGIHTATASLVAGVNANTGVDLRFRANRSGENQTIGNINGYWNDTVVGQIRFMAGEDTTNKDDGHLVFYTAPSGTVAERLRITSAGLVGIDTTAPRCALDLGDNDHTDGASLSNTPADYQLGVHAAQSTTGDIGRNIGFIALNANKVTAAINSVDDGTNDTSGLLFATGNGSGLSERLKVTGGGDVEFYGTAAGVTSAYWDASANSLIFQDSSEARFGDGGDLRVYHDGSNSFIRNNTGYLSIRAKDDENSIFCQPDAEVNLYYNGGKTLETTANGVTIYDDGKDDEARLIVQGGEGSAATLYLYSDDGDDNADKWRLLNENTGEFKIQNYASGSWETNFKGIADGASVLYHNNTNKFETTNDGTVVTGIATATDFFVNTVAAKGLKNNATGQRFLQQASNETRIYHASNAQVKLTFRGTGDTYRGAVNADANGMALLTGAASEEYGILCVADGATNLYYDASKKFETTNDGVSITGIATVTQGLNTDGLLSEKFNTTAGKLSDNTNIDLEDGMVHYFSTQETTTSTPNIRYSSSKSLNNMLSTGDAISITVITTAAAGGYSANWTIDGSAVTEEWVGGSAPSAGGSDGLDIYGITILKTGSGAYKFIGNLTNAT